MQECNAFTYSQNFTDISQVFSAKEITAETAYIEANHGHIFITAGLQITQQLVMYKSVSRNNTTIKASNVSRYSTYEDEH